MNFVVSRQLLFKQQTFYKLRTIKLSDYRYSDYSAVRLKNVRTIELSEIDREWYYKLYSKFFIKERPCKKRSSSLSCQDGLFSFLICLQNYQRRITSRSYTVSAKFHFLEKNVNSHNYISNYSEYTFPKMSGFLSKAAAEW